MPRIALLLLLLLTVAPASLARAAATLGAPAHAVRAGEQVELTWSGLPIDAEEAELEWSPTGKRWLRLTPELDAREGRYVWRVPHGVTGTVRVRLRAGDEHDEWIAAECTLELSADDSAPGPAPGRKLPEWWDLGEHAREPLTDRFAGERDSFQGRSLPCAISSSSSPLATPVVQETATELERTPATRRTLPQQRTFIAPRLAPLRN